MKRWLALSLVCGLAFFVGASQASEALASRQAMFLLRVLAYDRNLKNVSHDALNVLIVYQDGNDDSVAAKSELSAALDKLSDTKVADLPFRFASVPYTTSEDFDNVVSNRRATAVFVCAGLDSSIPKITEVTRRRTALTFSGAETYVRSGVSIGIVARGNRPVVMVNQSAAASEGADFDADFLRLAEVLR